MNRSKLISKISESSCISKVLANRILNVLTSAIVQSLKNGNHVSLMGFGTFTVKVRMERTVKNPKTGELIFIKATKMPVFRAGKRLKNSVN